jgi:hypothetical protein
MKIKDALNVVGSLSNPKKMPGFSFGLNPDKCNQGNKLSLIEGSVCFDCYAKKGFYKVYNKQMVKTWEKRLSGVNNILFEAAMITLIQKKSPDYFRWHDAGDIQDMFHLRKIVRIARALPNTKFWMPTKEVNLIRKYNKEYGEFPSNLVVRVSGFMIDAGASKGFANTSTVVTNKDNATCRAFENNNECGTCRKCWDNTVANVAYFKH